MKVLALDTVTEACSVALWSDTGVIARFEEMGRGHAEAVLGMVDEVLREGGVSLGALDGIAVDVGPGSFTGVRISVSAAQGLAFGADLPVVPVTSLEALASRALGAGGLGGDVPGGGVSSDGVLGGGAQGEGVEQALAFLDARMGEVYWGAFRRDLSRGVIFVGTPAVGPAACVAVPFQGLIAGIGRGFDAYPELRSLPGLLLAPGAGRALPDARDIAALGARRLALGEGIDPAELTPVYVRDKVAFTEAERAAAKQAAAKPPLEP